MASYSAKIFNNAVSSLSAQQAIIAATANNIANVNTEGYVRRVVNLQTRDGGSVGLPIGNGVEVNDITRVNDAFLQGLTRDALADSNFYETQSEFLARVEPVFSLTEDVNSIGSAMTQFFSSLEDLSLNPASIELRSDVLERAQDLVDAINTSYNTVANLQTEAESRLSGEIDSINSITTEIARLNGLISQREASGDSTAADERDQRDLLLDQLSEKVSYDLVEDSIGSVTISLANGFPIVAGTQSRDLELVSDPSFAGGNYPPKLDGSNMKFIVFDYDPSSTGQAHLDLTQALANGAGTVGGLLNIRGVAASSDTSPFQASGSLPEIAGRIESIARDLLTRFNETYLGPDSDAGTAGLQPSAVTLDSTLVNPDVFGFFDTVSGLSDADADGIPEAADLAASTLTNFAGNLSLASSLNAPERIAAGRDTAAGTTISPGNGDNLLDTTDGLLLLKTATATFSSDASNSFTRSGVTYNDLYNETVGRVGNLKRRSDTSYRVADDNYLTMRAKRDEVSAVSLDEEFTNLIKFQKAFEANARVLRTAQDLLDTIIGLI